MPKNKKRSLIASFTVVATSCFAIGLNVYSHHSQTHEIASNTKSPRYLTNEEAALARGFFGSAIDTTGVRHAYIYDEGLNEARPHTIAGVVDGQTIYYFHGDLYHTDDYALTDTNDLYYTFAHELTHIWQRQHNLKETNILISIKGDENYNYLPNAYHRQFRDYGDEQQASMVADYLMLLFNKHSSWSRMPRTQDGVNHLQHIIESHFPQAAQTLEDYHSTGIIPWERQNIKKVSSRGAQAL